MSVFYKDIHVTFSFSEIACELVGSNSKRQQLFFETLAQGISNGMKASAWDAQCYYIASSQDWAPANIDRAIEVFETLVDQLKERKNRDEK